MNSHYPEPTVIVQLPVPLHVSMSDILDQQGRPPYQALSGYHTPLNAALCCPGLQIQGGPVHMSPL